ncbi:DUF7065 domain-containing protein [Natrinema gelatinilyticum]|uniref:DUF7065 domain-containing protein n=1 Tax=Natrinema gelatinilyticum TaxID=2961571 RepID=UPI0020C40173|nr:hypothetical protein [Natrinema gelatinilyticum]
MEIAPPSAEYLHEPMNRRLWNESYYFDFTADSIRGFMRLGYQPFERRANIWLYLVQNGAVYWQRKETIPIEQCHGHHVRTDTLEKSYRIIDPHDTWTISAEGTCFVSDESWDVLVGIDESVPVELDLIFSDPHHDAYSIDMLVDTQDHYDQTGHYAGQVTIDGTRFDVEGQGFRDHSWGWFRDWTPGEWGHYTGTLQFENGDCVTLVAQVRPDGSVRNTFGYRADGERVDTIDSASVICDDGFERGERGRAWAEGDRPGRVTYAPDFGDGQTKIHCTPRHNLPIGYEDRNWALSDPDGPWLKGVLNRMPVDCEWDGVKGSGWIEATHPFN